MVFVDAIDANGTLDVGSHVGQRTVLHSGVRATDNRLELHIVVRFAVLSTQPAAFRIHQHLLVDEFVHFSRRTFFKPVDFDLRGRCHLIPA